MTIHESGEVKSATTPAGDLQGRLLLVFLCLVWGTTWPLMKIALEVIPPLSMRTLTAAFGSLTLFAVSALSGRSLRLRTAKAWGHLFVISLLNIVGFSLFSAFAQIAAATTRVAILAYTMPIWTVVLAWIVLGERPDRLQQVAIVLCACGLAILILPLTATGVPLGAILAAASGLSWGAGTVYLKWARLEADPVAVAAWQVAIGFFVIGACMFAFDGRLNLDHAYAGALLAVAYTGMGGSGIAYALWFQIVRRVPAATAALGTLAIPVVGVISTILIIGERLTPADIIGFALIFAASACVVLTPHALAGDGKGPTP